LGVYAEIVPFWRWEEVVEDPLVKAVVLSGGPSSVYDETAPQLPAEFFSRVSKPVLGICYGAQLMAHLLGGRVGPAPGGEYGRTKLVVKNSEPLFTGTPTAQDVWMSHGDQVVELPTGFEVSASTKHCRLAAFQKEPLFFAVQFHPEVAHTQFGNALLKNFAFGVAKAEVNWNITDYVSEAVREIRETVGENGMVLGALSGGVDSAVSTDVPTSNETLDLLMEVLKKNPALLGFSKNELSDSPEMLLNKYCYKITGLPWNMAREEEKRMVRECLEKLL